MSEEIKVGSWVVVGKVPDYGVRVMSFDVGQVEKVTAKLVYVPAHYGKQHPRDNVIAMPDEAAARLFVARAKSAHGEAVRRQIAAWDAYKATIGKMIVAAAPPNPAKDTDDGE